MMEDYPKLRKAIADIVVDPNSACIGSWLRCNDGWALFIELLESPCDGFSIWHPVFLEEDSAVWRQGKIWSCNTYEKVTNRVNGQRGKERKHHPLVYVNGAVASPKRAIA